MRSKTDFIKSLKNKEYQARRNEMLFENLEKDEEKLKLKLNKIYKSEATKLDRQIAQYYAQYGKDNVIEYRKLLNNLSSSEVDLLMKDLDNFINKYPQHENIRRVRESIYKLDRLEGLRVSIDMQQLELAEKEKNEIEKHLLDAYEKGTIDSLNRLGHSTNFSAFNKDVARKFINEKWIEGKSLSNRIYENRSKVARFMTSEFRNGVIRGDSYRNISKNLTEKFTEASSRNAMRLIRTEGTRVMNESTITLFENEFEEYRYSAIFDDRTSQICMDLDGQVFKMKERQAGVNFPPMHPNCRSSYDIEIPKKWLEKTIDDTIEDTDKSDENNHKLMTKQHKKMYTYNKNKNISNENDNSNENSIIEKLQKEDIKYEKVWRYLVRPSEEKIISNLSGGDLTSGSCSSLAFAYAGNKNGLKVRDFRGGKSRDFFAQHNNIKEIANISGVKSFVEKEYSDFNAVLNLKQRMIKDKEYYLATGRHAAIVRKSEKGFEYLELQDEKSNGFKRLNNKVLRDRFKCKKSHTIKYIGKVKQESILIDIDSLKGNSEFKKILGYINTSKNKQIKGVGGSVK